MGDSFEFKGKTYYRASGGRVSLQPFPKFCPECGRSNSPQPDAKASGVEEWVLVPREPTEAMMAAWPRHYHGAGHERGIYRAMLAAAPTPPADPNAGVEEPEAIAYRIQSILADMLTVEDGEIMMVGPASYKIARLFKPAPGTSLRQQIERLEGELADLKHDIGRAQKALTLEVEARIEAEQQRDQAVEALWKIGEMLSTAFGAGVYDMGPPAPGTEGSRSHSRNGYAQAVFECARAALSSIEGAGKP